VVGTAVRGDNVAADAEDADAEDTRGTYAK
jgi:hypothetical protein